MPSRSASPTTAPACRRRCAPDCSSRSSRRRKPGWEWGCRSAIRLPLLMMASCGPSKIQAAVPFFTSACRSRQKRDRAMAEALPVYIVDDDDAVRESTALLLEARSLTVRTFASAQDFLDAATSLAAGCVVSDLRMPKMSGLELLRRLQELKLPHSVVVMTAHGEVSLAVQALKGGAIDFI